ncbi:MAG: response regulator transcription factor [Bacteroidetes bacterium]|nr:response regulator transcription factor [Bacteroidota bacterium]
MDEIRILLIEDNILLSEGITAMLVKHGGFEVVARSEDGDAVRQLKSLDTPPDIVLLDLGLEKANSLSLMALLKDEIPAARIIAMDILPEHVDIVEFVRAGGHGFILKNASPEDWIDTIKAVAGGETVLPPTMTNSLFTQIITDVVSSGRSFPESGTLLTQRERQIVHLIADGMSNKEIAAQLHIATYTVKSHVHNILEKMTLSSRLQIAAYVRKEDF